MRIPQGTAWAWYMLLIILLMGLAVIFATLAWNSPTT